MSRDSKLLKAAKNMDWQQVVQNGGPPCFHLDGEKFCGRAKSWHHKGPHTPPDHKFISLSDLLELLGE